MIQNGHIHNPKIYWIMPLPTKFSDLFSEKIVDLDTIKFFENDFESVVFPTYPEIGA